MASSFVSSKSNPASRITEIIDSYCYPEDEKDFCWTREFNKVEISRLFKDRARYMSARFMSEYEPSLSLPYLDWKQRPKEIRQDISKAFEKICDHSSSSWGYYNGSERYGICGIDEADLLKRIILQAPKTQKEFYVLDIGAGNFQWGRDLADYINKQEDIPRDITVHFIGVRGERSHSEKVKESGRCKLYELGAFKVEELIRGLRRQGLFVEGRVDLIATRWCFRHLVDPLGTFAQAYNLLRPESGFFLGDGFAFLNNEETYLDSPNPNLRMIKVLQATKSPFLMQYYSETRSLNRFILIRGNAQPCRLPMSYLGVQYCGSDYQIGSERVTRFKGPDTGTTEDFHFPMPQWFTKRDCLYGALGLFNWLKGASLTGVKEWHPLIKMDDQPGCEATSSSSSSSSS